MHSVYIIMEYYNGGSIFKRMIRGDNFTLDNIKKIMFSILQGLNWIHSKRIMHRDLKPENLMLKNKRCLHDLSIVDFGLASF